MQYAFISSNKIQFSRCALGSNLTSIEQTTETVPDMRSPEALKERFSPPSTAAAKPSHRGEYTIVPGRWRVSPFGAPCQRYRPESELCQWEPGVCRRERRQLPSLARPLGMNVYRLMMKKLQCLLSSPFPPQTEKQCNSLQRQQNKRRMPSSLWVTAIQESTAELVKVR